jgi:hypothetical protein
VRRVITPSEPPHVVLRVLFSLLFLAAAVGGGLMLAVFLGRVHVPQWIGVTAGGIYFVAAIAAYFFLKLTTLGKYLLDFPEHSPI